MTSITKKRLATSFIEYHIFIIILLDNGRDVDCVALCKNRVIESN